MLCMLFVSMWVIDWGIGGYPGSVSVTVLLSNGICPCYVKLYFLHTIYYTHIQLRYNNSHLWFTPSRSSVPSSRRRPGFHFLHVHHTWKNQSHSLLIVPKTFSSFYCDNGHGFVALITFNMFPLQILWHMTYTMEIPCWNYGIKVNEFSTRTVETGIHILTSKLQVLWLNVSSAVLHCTYWQPPLK